MQTAYNHEAFMSFISQPAPRPWEYKDYYFEDGAPCHYREIEIGGERVARLDFGGPLGPILNLYPQQLVFVSSVRDLADALRETSETMRKAEKDWIESLRATGRL